MKRIVTAAVLALTTVGVFGVGRASAQYPPRAPVGGINPPRLDPRLALINNRFVNYALIGNNYNDIRQNQAAFMLASGQTQAQLNNIQQLLTDNRLAIGTTGHPVFFNDTRGYFPAGPQQQQRSAQPQPQRPR